MSIQKVLFNEGRQGFALHKITSTYFTGRCSAYYWSNGKMHDCEWIRRDGQHRRIPITSPMYRYLESLGPIWM
jgi:hypothetical protein